MDMNSRAMVTTAGNSLPPPLQLKYFFLSLRNRRWVQCCWQTVSLASSKVRFEHRRQVGSATFHNAFQLYLILGVLFPSKEKGTRNCVPPTSPHLCVSVCMCVYTYVHTCAVFQLFHNGPCFSLAWGLNCGCCSNYCFHHIRKRPKDERQSHGVLHEVGRRGLPWFYSFVLHTSCMPGMYCTSVGSNSELLSFLSCPLDRTACGKVTLKSYSSSQVSIRA